MSLRGLVIIVLLALVTSAGAADKKITLNKSFWSGWQYSQDDIHFHNVGATAKTLRQVMADNDEAVAQLNSYKSKKVAGAVLGIPGGVLIGWPLGATIAGQDWKDSYTVMMAVGIPLGIADIILESSATKNLKRAVAIYNGEEQSCLDHVGVNLCLFRKSKFPGLRLSYSF
jgi:hypothetical protein